MKKFYNEPEMTLKIFEAENIVTASDGRQLADGETFDTGVYGVVKGTVSIDGSKISVTF